MASLPSLPKLPTQLPGISAATPAVLNAISLIAGKLPKLNPPFPIYAILDADTFLPLTIPDSWGELTIRNDFQVADYPIEGGAFAAYNKVKRPGMFDITLIRKGSDLARFAWLEAIRQQIQTKPLARYNVITPQGIFQSYTISRWSYQTRPDRGTNLLYLDLQFSEVLQIEGSSLKEKKPVEPESEDMEPQGRVFSSETPPEQANLAASGAGNLGG